MDFQNLDNSTLFWMVAGIAVLFAAVWFFISLQRRKKRSRNGGTGSGR